MARRRRTSGSASRKAKILVAELYGQISVTSPKTTCEDWSGSVGSSFAIAIVDLPSDRGKPELLELIFADCLMEAQEKDAAGRLIDGCYVGRVLVEMRTRYSDICELM